MKNADQWNETIPSSKCALQEIKLYEDLFFTFSFLLPVRFTTPGKFMLLLKGVSFYVIWLIIAKICGYLIGIRSSPMKNLSPPIIFHTLSSPFLNMVNLISHFVRGPQAWNPSEQEIHIYNICSTAQKWFTWKDLRKNRLKGKEVLLVDPPLCGGPPSHYSTPNSQRPMPNANAQRMGGFNEGLSGRVETTNGLCLFPSFPRPQQFAVSLAMFFAFSLTSFSATSINHIDTRI